MPFQLQADRWRPQPVAHGPGQGSEQEVVDLGVIGGWGLMEQRIGLRRRQCTGHLVSRGEAVLAVREFTLFSALLLGEVSRQLNRGGCGYIMDNLRPPSAFGFDLLYPLVGQPTRPIAEGRALGGELDRLALAALLVGAL